MLSTLLGLTIPLLAVAGGVSSSSRSNVRYVDPMIGTMPKHPGDYNYGGMIPSVASPFAMTRWTPTTQQNYVSVCPFTYQGTLFHGFQGTHQPAVWMGESAHVVVAPGVGSVKTTFEDRALLYSHSGEVSSPHYYSTVLTVPPPLDDRQIRHRQPESSINSTILAELAATSRASVMRFTFDHITIGEAPFVTVQITTEHMQGEAHIDPIAREIYGWNPERQDDILGPFEAVDFKGYFVIRFEEEFSEWGTANNSTLCGGCAFGEGLELSAYATFASGQRAVNVRVGVSYISVEQARQNLENEIPIEHSLETTSGIVEQEWADKLDLVQIANATATELTIFYTSFYHALQYPNEMMEHNASGTYYYSGYDNAVHAGSNAYTGYSIWDTFRAEWAFLILFAPERIDGMVQSMLQTYQQAGRLPMWMNIVETNIMIGTHSSSLIAESLAKGFTGFDAELAWEAIFKDAMVPPEDDLTTLYYDRQPGTSCEARAGLTREKDLGYVAAERTSEAGSRTLDYAYDDYTVAVAAELTGHAEFKDYFMKRSKNYHNIFNNETMFMEARNEDGSWNDNRNTWTEGDKWVYTFNVQHDFPGLRELFNGPEALGDKLDEYYNDGHNEQANEPSHATVYAYLYADRPWRTQSVIRSLLKSNYFTNPVGLSGNDDCGQMSAWYMFNAMGMYPMNPASGEYVIGSPIFDSVQVSLPLSDHVLRIDAPGARGKPFIKTLTIDGVEIDKPVIAHKDLFTMSTISFEMSDEPQMWGAHML